MPDRPGYVLAFEDTFSGTALDRGKWIPHYLPHWSSREASAARYSIANETGLRLRIDADQQPWCPEWDGFLRVSSLQTGAFAGPLGSHVGRHRFSDELVVREVQPPESLFLPAFGLIECRARAIADPANMVALWMIGYEDRPERSAEICIFEIFGRDVRSDATTVGMG